jgi:hypothetical protein
MTDSVTGKVKMILVPGAGRSDLVEKEELEDIVLEYREKFEAEVKGGQARRLMPRNDQHDMGKTLNEIGASQQHRRESLHGRFW